MFEEEEYAQCVICGWKFLDDEFTTCEILYL